MKKSVRYLIKLNKMKQSDLKKGLEFSFSTPKNIDDLRIAEVIFSEGFNRFCIMFNGQLFTFKTFSGMKKKLDKLIKKWNLEDITDSVREQNSNTNLIAAAPELLNILSIKEETENTGEAVITSNVKLGEFCTICKTKINYRESEMPHSFPESMRKYPNIFYGCKCYEGSSKSIESATRYYIEGMKSINNK